MKSIVLITQLMLTCTLVSAQFSYPPSDWLTTNAFPEVSKFLWEHTWHTMDIDGDNLPDLVETYHDDYFGSPGNYHWQVYLNTGSEFSSTPINWSTPDGYYVVSQSTGQHVWNVLDMNGDGLPDLVETYNNAFFGTAGNYYWKVYLNTGSGFSSSPVNWTTTNGYALVSNSSGSTAWNTMDIDGDNLPDLVETYDNALFGSAGSYYWKVYLNTGSGFNPVPLNWLTSEGFALSSSFTGSFRWHTMDIDGDHLPDLIETYDNALFGSPGNYYWKVFLNTGSGFTPSPINWLTTEGFPELFHSTGTDAWHTMDMDGDDLPDLVETYDNGFFGTAGNYYWKVFQNTGSGFNPTPFNWLTTEGFPQAFRSTGTEAWATMDMDGDDLPDLVETYDNDLFGSVGAYYWKIHTNTNTGIVSTQDLANHSSVLNVFPNPTENRVRLDLTGISVPSIQLYNSVGLLIYEEQNIFNNELNIDLSNHASGIYHLRVLSKDKTFSTKLIKQ